MVFGMPSMISLKYLYVFCILDVFTTENFLCV